MNNKKITKFVMMLIMFLSVMYINPAKSYAAGDNDYIEIRSVTDLMKIHDNLAGHYILMNNIDLSEATDEGGVANYQGNGWRPIGMDLSNKHSEFTGIFDGNDYSITGVKIKGLISDQIGFFSCVGSEGIIKNLKLQITNNNGEATYNGDLVAINKGTIENCNILSEHTTFCIGTMNIYNGGVAGYNYGTIRNCIVRGSISGSLSTESTDTKGYYNLYNGAIAGGSEGKIEKCFGYASMHSTVYDGIYDYYNTHIISYTGGIVGCQKEGAIVQNSLSKESIEAEGNGYGDNSLYKYKINIGGICGNDQGKIDRCYSYITDVNYAAYGIGGNERTNCYFRELTHIRKQSGAVQLTDAQMHDKDTYKGFDFDIIWKMDTLDGLKLPSLRDEIELVELSKTPDKLAYYTQGKLDFDGGELTIYYSDGKTETIPFNKYMHYIYDMSAVGTQDVIVSYRNHEVKYQIVVTQKPKVVGVELVSLPNKTEFARDTKFDFSGCKAQILYENGTSEIIDIDATMTSGGDNSKIGEYVITYTVDGYTVSFNIRVVPIKVEKLEVTTMPKQTIYVKDEPFNSDGMVVTAMYNNGQQKVVTDFTVDEFVNELGEQLVTIRYGVVATNITITVADLQPIALMIMHAPAKTSYIEGEPFDGTGMEVNAIYSSGFSKKITNYEISSIPAGVGSKKVTISCGAASTTVSITVTARILQSIEIISLPDKVKYIEGEKFAEEGLQVSASYNNGTKEIIKDYILSGATTNEIGKKTITVLYNGKSTSFIIEVVEANIISLMVDEPQKKDYLMGEKLDFTDMKVTVVYDNGYSKQITDYSIIGSTAVAGEQIVTVQYGKLDYTFKIKVHVLPEEWTIVKKPTCDNIGKKVKRCLDCGELIEEEEIQKTPHEYGEPIFVWAQDYNTCRVKYLCKNNDSHIIEYDADVTSTVKQPATCSTKGTTLYTARYGDIFETKEIQNIEIDKSNHEGKINVRNVKAATCGEDGYTGDKYCELCDELIESGHAIAKLQHEYGEPIFIWSADHRECSVKYVCKMDSSHVEEHDAVVTYIIKTPATCVAKGVTTYKAVYKDLTVETDVQDIAIDNNNHSWNNEYTIDVPATNVKTGKQSIHCSLCDAKKGEKDIPIIKAQQDSKEQLSENKQNGHITRRYLTQKIKCAKIKKYKAKKLKRKKITFLLKASASGKGKLTYKVTKGKRKYIVVTKRGKVTLKKGCKKGVYKIMITAAKNNKYAKASKIIKIRVN